MSDNHNSSSEININLISIKDLINTNNNSTYLRKLKIHLLYGNNNIIIIIFIKYNNNRYQLL